MIVALSVSATLSRPRPDSETVRQATEKPQENSTVDDATPGNDPLSSLQDFEQNAARLRKANAEEQLKFIREQMNALILWGPSLAATASRSAQLAKQLGAAAAQFSGALPASNTTSGQTQAPTLDPVSAAATPESGSTATAGTQEQAFVPQAYLDLMEEPAPVSPWTSKDDETAGDFKSMALQLHSILDKASDRLRDKGEPTLFADRAKNILAAVPYILSSASDSQSAARSSPISLFL